MAAIFQTGQVKNGNAVIMTGKGEPTYYDTPAQVIDNISGTLTYTVADAKYYQMDEAWRNNLSVSTDDYAMATGVNTTITYPAAGARRNHIITGVGFGYRTAPGGGSGYLQIEDGSGNVVFRVPVTNAGAGFFPFDPPKRGGGDRAMIITLGAAGSGVIGEISALGHRIE